VLYKSGRSKIHRRGFDEHLMKLESTAVEMFRKEKMVLFLHNIAHLCPKRRICRIKNENAEMDE
jgi:hypothetical protein